MNENQHDLLWPWPICYQCISTNFGSVTSNTTSWRSRIDDVRARQGILTLQVHLIPLPFCKRVRGFQQSVPFVFVLSFNLFQICLISLNYVLLISYIGYSNSIPDNVEIFPIKVETFLTMSNKTDRIKHILYLLKVLIMT